MQRIGVLVMDYLLCECAFQNPIGTKLCAKCGRPLTQEEKEKPLADMRYDGIAIRSKTHNKSIIDKVWNFFSSVKVGVTLIVLNLIAAAIGTILPQEFYVNVITEPERAAYYANTYGTFGKLYYELGLSDLYSSWWFRILVGLLAVSIIVASIDRGIPLHKSLKNQRVKRHASFMKRQRLVASGPVADDALEQVEALLVKQKYKVRREEKALLAERGRFSRYGPYINHVGLIIFLGAIMMRSIPGFYVDESIYVREGEIRAVTGMDGYFIENKDFILETYDNTPQGEQIAQGVNVVAKNFQTDVVLYKLKDGAVAGQEDDLQKVMDYSIFVNNPLRYDGFSIFQMDFRLNEIKSMNFELTNKETGESLGDVHIDLTDPQTVYEIDGETRVELVSYYPDFDGFKEGVPQNASPTPNNPAFIFKMYTPTTPEGETSFVAIQQTVEPMGDNAYKMSFTDVEVRDLSGLTIRKDRTIPLLFAGGAIFMLGVIIGSYWNHRRIWLEQQADGTLQLAAHTNKNWFSLKKDLTALHEEAGIPLFIDQAELTNDDNQQAKGTKHDDIN